MSATTGIPSGSLWSGETSHLWKDRRGRTRTISVTQETPDHGPPNWLVNLGQVLLAAVFTILSIPVLVIGAIVAAVVAAWVLVVPALIAGFVIALTSFVVAGL